jgi:hypothetical protein
LAYLIEADEPAGAGVQRVLEEQRGRVLWLLTSWEDDPAGSIHRVRQSCKRARAAAQLLKVAAPYAAMVENDFFRGVQQGVAYARDNEALVEALDLLQAGVAEPRLSESVMMLRNSCAARAAQSLQDNHSTLGARIEVACGQLRRAERRLARLPSAELRRRDLRRGARKTWKRCVAGYLELEPDSSRDSFHMWRRQVKYAFNETRLLAAIRQPDVEAPLRELAATLGRCHDLELLEALLREQRDTLRIDTHVQRLRHLIGESLKQLRGRSLEIGSGLFLPDGASPVTEQQQSGKHPATEGPKDPESSLRRAIPDRDSHSSRRWQLR